MTRKWMALTLAIVMATALFTGCSKGTTKETPTTTTPPVATVDPNKPVDGGTLTVGTFSDIVTVNPIMIDDTSSADVASFLFAQLYDVNGKGEVIVSPWSIAKEPFTVSADKKSYTVKIRTDAKWSDGKPITADDVVFTYKTLSNEAVGSPGYSSYAQIADVKANGADTVVITLKDVDSRFEYSLTANIVPAASFKDVKPEDIAKSKFGTDLKLTVTSGPYTWAEWTEKQYIKLKKNPNYWGQKPHIDEIVFKIYADQNTEVQALMKGEIDFLETVPVAQLDALKGVQGIQIYEDAGPVYDYVAFNFGKDNWPGGFVPFTGAKTRQAINYALNRKGMVDSVLKGHGTLLNGPFLASGWAASPEVTAKWEFDVAKAKALLAEDGWKAGADGILVKDGHKFEFELMTNAGNKRRESYAAIIQQNLADVGIKVNIKTLDFSAMIPNNVTPGKYQALLLGWQLGLDPDAESIFSSKFYPPAGQNSGWYKNEKTDALWEKGYKVTSRAERKAVYADILKEFANDPPYVFLASQNLMTAYNQRVKWAKEDAPVQAIPYGYFYHVLNWWVTK
ncbi:MAG TPA: ABC transporter substrate-binding protein [Symbiobacteriaceae bacterium]|nr:ABC transporter substrate-binding protein [Symbiobacteriaceae bacterium]